MENSRAAMRCTPRPRRDLKRPEQFRPLAWAGEEKAMYSGGGLVVLILIVVLLIIIF
jgi:hypothetical protein